MVHINTRFFPLVDCDHHAMTALFEYRGSLACLCDKSEVEDEYHFVIICPSYINLRQMYIHPYYFRKPSVFKFTQLMQNKNMSILKKLGKYIYEAFNLRKSLLVN